MASSLLVQVLIRTCVGVIISGCYWQVYGENIHSCINHGGAGLLTSHDYNKFVVNLLTMLNHQLA